MTANRISSDPDRTWVMKYFDLRNLWVMGLPRFRCATVIVKNRYSLIFKSQHRIRMLSQVFVKIFIPSVLGQMTYSVASSALDSTKRLCDVWLHLSPQKTVFQYIRMGQHFSGFSVPIWNCRKFAMANSFTAFRAEEMPSLISYKMYLKHHEKQVEDILNYLDEIYLHRIERMEKTSKLGNELKTELKKIRIQIVKLQKKSVRAKDKIAFAQYIISNLNRTFEKNPSSSTKTNQEDL
ncbi:hypothetical protein Tco_0783371 [Tanacetum coccineum]